VKPAAEAPGEETSTFLRVQDLGIRYREKLVLANVTLAVRKARITALIGPSGCGKTSLLSALNRMTDLVRGCRVEGRVLLDGRDVFAPEIDVVGLRRRVGMIFQKPNPFPLSVRRNLELPLIEHGLCDRTERAETIERSLVDVGLWNEVKDRLDAPALALSGGQQQRLCIARALALEPEAVLFDEPCSALDPLSSGVVEDLIASLRPRYSVVIVTHNLAQARRIADDAAFFWLENGIGRLIESGPATHLLDSPTNDLTAAYVRGIRG
jgi:phosphate transport system ATP-binding protein